MKESGRIHRYTENENINNLIYFNVNCGGKELDFPHDGSAYKRESLILYIRSKNTQWFSETFKWTSLTRSLKQTLLYSIDIQKREGETFGNSTTGWDDKHEAK